MNGASRRAQLALFGGEAQIDKSSIVKWPAPSAVHEEAVIAAVRSGKFHRVNHPIVLEFEASLAGYAGVASRATGSGSSALQIATDFYTDPGDEILVPALNWPGAVGHAAALGRRLRFADVDLQSGCLASHVGPGENGAGVAMIVPTHLFGNWAPYADATSETVVPVLHDCAQAVGAIPHLPKGDQTCAAVSGNGAKHLAAGELGAVCTTNLGLIDHVDEVSLSSSDRNGQRVFAPSSLGFNFRPNVFSAAVAVRRLEVVEEDLVRRRRNAAALWRRLRNLPGLHGLFREDERNSFLVLAMRFVPSEVGLPSVAIVRDRLVQLLEAEGAPVGVWMRSPVWEYLPHVADERLEEFPNTATILAQEIHVTEIAAPNGLEEMASIARAFEKVWDNMPYLRDWLIRGD